MASTDRDALLALFRSTGGSGWKNSNNWNTDAPLSDWYGVEVDGEGRVVELRLEDNNLRGSIPKELGGLVSLTVLLLDDNKLTGVIPTELGRLVTLQTLHLDRNSLTGSIPKEVGRLLNLEDLRLNGNKLAGVIPTELGRLESLQMLLLDGNGLTGSIPKELGGLLNLAALRLYDNKLTGAIPTELDRLESLRILYLNGNGLTGSIPKELGGLLNLDDLRLHDNKLTGAIPTELGRLESLRILYLYGNGLTGSIPKELGGLLNLDDLRLQDNKLTGVIPTELGRLESLRILNLNGNGLTGSIPKELGGLHNLDTLRLYDNKLTGAIPTELGRLESLRILYLNGNGLTGSIPKELGGLLNLDDLRLHRNKLTGAIPTELGRLESLRILYLNGNGLTGSIPKELGGLLNLDDLRLHRNKLTGAIPTELGRLESLRILYLNGNGLTGSIPKELGGLLNLDDLRLHRNKLTGVIPTELGRLVKLRILYLNGNGLTGSIPKELGGLLNLDDLQLQRNKLTGPIPEELGDLVKLEVLRLDVNKLTAVIPTELRRLVKLRILYLNGNGLTGVIPEELGGLSKLEDLAVGGNKLSGGVPKSLLEHPYRKESGFQFHVTEDGAPVPAYKSWKGVAIQLVLGYADVGTDVDAVVSYYQADHMWWFALGMVFIIGPALFAAMVLLRREHWLRRSLVALQLGMLLEAFVSWVYSIYSPVLASLRVMEPLYESVPQLMLQLYGLLLEWDNDGTHWLSRRLLSIVFSCFTLAYATTGLVAEQPLSRLSPTADAASASCPGLTGLLFGAVPASNSSVAVYRSNWNSQNFVWAFLFYQVLEVAARFISLALLALVWRAHFFLALLWLWGSRALILRRLLAGEGVSRVRSQLRLVGMPFMDSVMDTLDSYDRGCALTTVEFVFCLAIGNMFNTNEGGQLPADIGRVWTYVAVVCMAGKLCSGYLIVRPFKRVVRFGTEQEEQTSGRQHRGGDVGGTGDFNPGGSSRADDGGMLGGKRERTGDGDEGSSVVSDFAGPERRRGSRVHDVKPFSASGKRGTLSWTAREESQGAAIVGGRDRQGEPDSADSSAGLEMLTGMEEGKVARELSPSEGTDLQPVAQALTTVATGSASDGLDVQDGDDAA